MSEADRVQETVQLRSELKDISSKDLQLWSIGLLMLVVLAIGFATLVAPNLLWKKAPVTIEARYLPQLFWGFIVLIALFNLYLFDQKRRLHSTREQLIRRLIYVPAGSDLSLIDATSKLYNSRYLAMALYNEAARSKRYGGPLAILAIDIEGFSTLTERFGSLIGDHAVLVVSELLRRTFRGTDIICRHDSHRFVVILPETTEQQGRRAATRLSHAVFDWNEQTQFAYKLELNLEVSAYVHGSDAQQLLASALEHLAQAHAANNKTVSGGADELAKHLELPDAARA